jgi:GAF domain-containing protein
MADGQLLTAALSQFARTLAQGFAISDVLHDLVERVTDVLGVDYAGVSVQESGQLRFVTAVSEQAATLERVQEALQAGPCVDAWRSGEAVIIPDLRETPHRWGRYTQAASEVGIIAISSIPMRRDTENIGALDVYSSTRRDWSSDDLAVASTFADMATSYIVSASELDRQRRVNEQLREALESRIVIEQAKGMLAAERGIPVDQAFEVLRRHARNNGVTLRSVARAVVSRELRP